MFVALLDRGAVADLLPQVPAREFHRGFAAARAQRIRIALPRQRVFAVRGETVPQFFPGLAARALRATRGEAITELPGRDLRERIYDQSVVEERDEHGMPRLRE